MAINEHSLESYVAVLLQDANALNAYDRHAFLRDAEFSNMLKSLLAGMCFTMNFDMYAVQRNFKKKKKLKWREENLLIRSVVLQRGGRCIAGVRARAAGHQRGGGGNGPGGCRHVRKHPGRRGRRATARGRACRACCRW
jgi:hypothetical protein